MPPAILSTCAFRLAQAAAACSTKAAFCCVISSNCAMDWFTWLTPLDWALAACVISRIMPLTCATCPARCHMAAPASCTAGNLSPFVLHWLHFASRAGQFGQGCGGLLQAGCSLLCAGTQIEVATGDSKQRPQIQRPRQMVDRLIDAHGPCVISCLLCPIAFAINS